MTEQNMEASAEEVIEAFTTHLAERADAGNMAAKAVTNVSLDNRVLTVTFDIGPALTELQPSNLARLPGGAIAFRNEQSNHIRSGVDVVATQLPDGTSLGELTAAELYKLATGDEIPN